MGASSRDSTLHTSAPANDDPTSDPRLWRDHPTLSALQKRRGGERDASHPY
jgi:hypothetical protein